MRTRLTIALVFAMAITFVPIAPAVGTTGWMAVNSDMTLTADHYGNIAITADNVTLDCDGHSINGEGVGDGINLAYRTGVSVRNCVIKGFSVGLRLQFSSNGNVIEDNTANMNLNWGFIVGEGSTGNLLQGNTAVRTGLDGFAIFGFGTDNNRLVGNEATNNARYGFVTSGAPANNQFEGNKATNNGDVGFLIQTTWFEGTTLRDNSAVGNGSTGFSVSSNALAFPAKDNVLIGNSATNNGSVGFALANAHNNVLEGNNAKGNSDGFAFWVSARENVLTGNQANANERNGFYVGPGSVDNDLESNVANHNGSDGFSLMNADDNTLIGNEASHNKFVGFRVFDWPSDPEPSEQSDGNLFESNTGCHNHEWDAEDSTTRGTNIWLSNDFCTEFGS